MKMEMIYSYLWNKFRLLHNSWQKCLQAREWRRSDLQGTIRLFMFRRFILYYQEKFAKKLNLVDPKFAKTQNPVDKSAERQNIAQQKMSAQISLQMKVMLKNNFRINNYLFSFLYIFFWLFQSKTTQKISLQRIFANWGEDLRCSWQKFLRRWLCWRGILWSSKYLQKW